MAQMGCQKTKGEAYTVLFSLSDYKERGKWTRTAETVEE